MDREKLIAQWASGASRANWCVLADKLVQISIKFIAKF